MTKRYTIYDPLGGRTVYDSWDEASGALSVRGPGCTMREYEPTDKERVTELEAEVARLRAALHPTQSIAVAFPKPPSVPADVAGLATKVRGLLHFGSDRARDVMMRAATTLESLATESARLTAIRSAAESTFLAIAGYGALVDNEPESLRCARRWLEEHASPEARAQMVEDAPPARLRTEGPACAHCGQSEGPVFCSPSCNDCHSAPNDANGECKDTDKCAGICIGAESAIPEGPAPWRVGRTLGRTLYHHGQFVGAVDTPELAKALVDAANGQAAHAVPADVAGPVPDRMTLCIYPDGTAQSWDAICEIESDVRKVDYVRATALESLAAENARLKAAVPADVVGLVEDLRRCSCSTPLAFCPACRAANTLESQAREIAELKASAARDANYVESWRKKWELQNGAWQHQVLVRAGLEREIAELKRTLEETTIQLRDDNGELWVDECERAREALRLEVAKRAKLYGYAHGIASMQPATVSRNAAEALIWAEFYGLINDPDPAARRLLSRLDALEGLAGFISKCGVCCLPATYERGLCLVCDACQAQEVPGGEPQDYGARELRQAPFVRDLAKLDARPTDKNEADGHERLTPERAREFGEEGAALRRAIEPRLAKLDAVTQDDLAHVVKNEADGRGGRT